MTDDYSRVAYAEVHDNETAITAVSALERAVTWFAQRGTAVECVLSDNLDGWLHYYDHHRPHTACSNQPPFSRLTNVSDQYS